MKKLLSLLLIICSIGVAYADDKSTVTSLKYVTDELNTRQDKFGANDGKAMTFTNVAGGNLPRDVKESLGTSTTDPGLPTVSAVNTGIATKQDEIGAANTNTVVTYTGTPGTLGQKGIYQDTGTYAAQQNNLIQASTFNAALRNGLNNEFVCADRDPVSNQCWLWSIDNDYNGTTVNYISATGTGYQNGTPTPTNPIDPVFYHQGDMILRKVGSYADSYDATTHKITRRVGVKVFDGTENIQVLSTGNNNYIKPDATDGYFMVSNGRFASGTGYSNQYALSTTRSIWSEYGHPNEFALNSDSTGGIQIHLNTANEILGITDYTAETVRSATTKIKAFLARQYAAGTPVTVYYPLATPVEENWPDTTYNTSVYIPQNQPAQNQ